MTKGRLFRHKRFFDRLAKRLGCHSREDWYNVKLEVIIKHGGQRVLQCYNNSPLNALQSVFPEHNWIPWKFGQVPQGFWEKRENQLEYFSWLGEQLGYRSMD